MARPGVEDGPEDRSLWHMIIAPTVWAVHFAVCYAVQAIWCAKVGGDIATLRIVLVAITIVALAIIAFFGFRAWQRWDYFHDRDYIHGGETDEDRREFLGHTGFMLACLSFVAVLYVAMPFLIIGSCI